MGYFILAVASLVILALISIFGTQSRLKYIAMSLVSLALVLILAIPVMFLVVWGYAQLSGANWYELGCIDGVAQAYIASKGTADFNVDRVNKDFCFKESRYYKKKGSL